MFELVKAFGVETGLCSTDCTRVGKGWKTSVRLARSNSENDGVQADDFSVSTGYALLNSGLLWSELVCCGVGIVDFFVKGAGW